MQHCLSHVAYRHSALTDWFADKLFQSSPLGNSTDVFLDSICSTKSIRKIFFPSDIGMYQLHSNIFESLDYNFYLF